MNYSEKARKVRPNVKKLASTAAKKKGTPVVESTPMKVEKPKSTEIDEKAGYTVTSYFQEKIAPTSNTIEYWREKVAEKSKVDHSLQLEILSKAEQLINIPYSHDYDSFNRSFNIMYRDVEILQRRQNFSRAAWKIIILPIFLPPIHRPSILVCGIFHTNRNLNIFSNWQAEFDQNIDFKICQDPFMEPVDQPNADDTDEIIANAESLLADGGPPYTQPRHDWSSEISDIIDDEMKDDSLNFGPRNRFLESFSRYNIETFDAGNFQRLPCNGLINGPTEKLGSNMGSNSEPGSSSNETNTKILKNLTKADKLSILEGTGLIHNIIKPDLKRSVRKRRPMRYIPIECFEKMYNNLYRLLGQ